MRKYLFLTLGLLAILMIAGYVSLIRKPDIIFINQELNFTNIVVKQFPLTEGGRVEWWKNNREKLKNKYNIPAMAKNGDWYVDIWNFGEGFKKAPEGDIRVFNSDTQDMMCFDNDSEKCIDKELLMRIENNRQGGITIIIGNRKIYYK